MRQKASARSTPTNFNIITVFQYSKHPQRAIKMIGVEVTTCPLPLRKTAWTRLTNELSIDLLEQIYKVISLEEVPQFAEDLLAGQINGRVVVDLRL